MKHRQLFNILFIAFVVALILNACSGNRKSAGSNTMNNSVQNMLDLQRFVFQAHSVTPLRGHFRSLTSPYDVSVSKDTLRSYLPYFGRAYSPPLNQTESALNFTSTNFSYSVSRYKKNGWNVVIKPKDRPDVQQYSFTIFDNGSVTLNVMSNSRDAITFNGQLQQSKQ